MTDIVVVSAARTALGRFGSMLAETPATEPGSVVIHEAIARAGWSVADVEPFELDEAFAARACAVNKVLEAGPAKVDVDGGAIAIGHPTGGSGRRILVTPLHAMQRRDATRRRGWRRCASAAAWPWPSPSRAPRARHRANPLDRRAPRGKASPIDHAHTRSEQ